MAESVFRFIEKCEICGATFMPKNGEVCKCPDPESDEPVVRDWDDTSPTPQGDCYEQ